MGVLTTEAKTKLAGYKDEFLAIHPNNEMIDNPDFDDQIPEHPDTNPQKINAFTDAQWIDEYVKRHLIIQLQRGKRLLLQADDVIPEYDDVG